MPVDISDVTIARAERGVEYRYGIKQIRDFRAIGKGRRQTHRLVTIDEQQNVVYAVLNGATMTLLDLESYLSCFNHFQIQYLVKIAYMQAYVRYDTLIEEQKNRIILSVVIELKDSQAVAR